MIDDDVGLDCDCDRDCDHESEVRSRRDPAAAMGAIAETDATAIHALAVRLRRMLRALRTPRA